MTDFNLMIIDNIIKFYKSWISNSREREKINELNNSFENFDLIFKALKRKFVKKFFNLLLSYQIDVFN